MSKPKILLYCNVYDSTVGQGIAYMNFFGKFGDVFLVTSEMNLERCLKEGDILALPGGQDVLSTRYNFSPGFYSKNVNAHYEFLDKNLLMPWIKTGKPIIGICRGMQTLNVAMGGTLYRHIDGHVQDDKKGRWDRPQEMYTDIKGHQVYMINSYHHQAVKEVAKGFTIIGWSDVFDVEPVMLEKHWYFEDKKKKTFTRMSATPMIPEIMTHDTLPYVAFQYHPEEFDCPLAISLIKFKLSEYYKTQEDYKTSITNGQDTKKTTA